jgi:hypothetical protein
MRRIAHRLYGIRFLAVTSIVLVVAAIVPLVALAGSGDPLGG